MADAKEIIGDYRLRNLLQTGQTSQVYEVVEVKSNRHFAMKILLPEHATNKAHQQTLVREAEIGVKMRHENVINIVRLNRSPTNPYFIMEFFPWPMVSALRPRCSSSARWRLARAHTPATQLDLARLGLNPATMSWIHASTVTLFLGLAIGLFAYSKYVLQDAVLVRPTRGLLDLVALQAVVGFLQLSYGLPWWLLIVHAALSAWFWIAVLNVRAAVRN